MLRGVIALIGVIIPLFFVVPGFAALPAVNDSGYAYTPAFTRSDGKCGYWKLKYYVGPTWISSGSDGLEINGNSISLINSSGDDSDYGYSYQLSSYKEHDDGIHWTASISASYYKFRPPYTGLDTYFTLLEPPDVGSCVDPCQSEMDILIAQCGSDNWKWTNEETCVGVCKCPVASLIDCSDKGGVYVYDYEHCLGACNDCQDSYMDAVIECHNEGIGWFDINTCEYVCDSCNVRYALAMSECGGDLASYECDEYQTNDGWLILENHQCVDNTTAPPLPQEPQENSSDYVADNPTAEPEPDTTGQNGEFDAATTVLKSIKTDTGNLVTVAGKIEQNTGQIEVNTSDIRENLQAAISNQDVLNAAVRGVQGSVESVGANVVGAVSGLSGDIQGVGDQIEGAVDGLGDKLDEIAENTEAEWDGTLPTENEYSAEYSESELPTVSKTPEELAESLGAPTGWASSVTNSGVELNDSSTYIPLEYKGQIIPVYFNQYADAFRIVGAVMYACSFVTAFFIIRGR